MNEENKCPLCGSEIFNNKTASGLETNVLVNGKQVYLTFKLETYEEGDKEPQELKVCPTCVSTLFKAWGKHLDQEEAFLRDTVESFNDAFIGSHKVGKIVPHCVIREVSDIDWEEMSDD